MPTLVRKRDQEDGYFSFGRAYGYILYGGQLANDMVARLRLGEGGPMTTYEQIQSAIFKAVSSARRADRKLAVGPLVLRISSAHAQSGLTLDELRASIDAEINR